MKSRVLYFPYIKVPESRWLTQMLLYWDQVSSIVPYDFLIKPELLGPYMLSLVREELVFQVMPGAYIYEIPRFFDEFKGYVGGLGDELADRRKRLTSGNTHQVHIEKLGDMGDFLVKEGLAAPKKYPWYDVERETADDFMSYLAGSLGQVQRIDSAPITDDGDYLPRMARAGVPQENMTMQLESLRIELLDKVLPVPNHKVQPSEIRTFKERHGKELGDFRRRLERELVDAASIPDAALRKRRLQIYLDEAEERVAEIQEAMKSAGWETARTGFSVLAAVPGASPILGLAGALWNAITGQAQMQMPRDFAYAAYARQLTQAV